MTAVEPGHHNPSKRAKTGNHPTRRLTLAALNAAFAPDGSRWRDDDWAAGFDPEPTFPTTPPGEPPSRRADYRVPCDRAGNDLRLKGRTAVARLAIVRWGGAKCARSARRTKARSDIRRRHCRLQPVDGA